MNLTIAGMGIVLYSPGVMNHVPEGEDFLAGEFEEPEQAAAHIRNGDITGFCTGSGGGFVLKFREGYPDKDIREQFPIAVRLAVRVAGGSLAAVDLFWLMDWSDEVPDEQKVLLEDGIYHVTVSTARPESGIWGDNQVIFIHLSKLEEMPALSWQGVPQLYDE